MTATSADDWLRRIDALPLKRQGGWRAWRGGRRILHYAYRFSQPTETFIYDLIRRLDSGTPHDNILLCQRRVFQQERPWAKALCLPWESLPLETSAAVFRHLAARCGIDLMVVHFADRVMDLRPLEAATGIRLPMVVMTHGHDVFQLHRPPPLLAHSQYLLGEVAPRPDVLFTAPSRYLADALVKGGVAEEKIALVPNAVDGRFFRHRKTGGFYRPGQDGEQRERPLRLLNIGRLFEVKGHEFLLEALARFRQECLLPKGEEAHLTIVYGNAIADNRLEKLQAQAASLGIAACVAFEPFVDFAADPGYMSRFDLYIHSSTYTNRPVLWSESFGLAALEAIAAGLPIIATDAGAAPEVVGYDSPHSRIVRHGSSDALFEALAAMHAAPQTFTDNRAYAQERLAKFSPQRQVAAMKPLLKRLPKLSA